MRGTKSQVRPGTWRLRVVTGYDPATGNPRQASRTFTGTEKEADSALAAFVAEVGAGRTALDRSTTVDALVERWLEAIEPSRSPTTMRGDRDKCRRISRDLGRVQLSQLTAQQLDRTYRRWLDEGLSPNTVHHIHAVLSAALHHAVKWDAVPRAVTARAHPPPLRVKAKAAGDVGVVRELVAAAGATQPVLSAAITVAATTGMRRGELCGLRWGDIDLDTGVLHVRRSVKHGLDHRQVVVGDTKTHQERRVALDDSTVTVLRAHRERVRRWATDAGVRLAGDGYVFTLDRAGTKPMLPDTLSQAFGGLVRKVGAGLSFHDLRHFAATTMIAGGIDVRTVAGRLGHADPARTLGVYSSFVKERDRRAADVLGGLLAGRPPVGVAELEGR